MTPVSRRTFLALGAAVLVGSPRHGAADPTTPSSASSAPTTTRPTTTRPTTTRPTTTRPATTTTPLVADPFTLGVASGDPDESSVVLWTRLVGADLPDEIEVRWTAARDEDFTDIAADGVVVASGAEGHSLHVLAELDGVAWYRFEVGGFTSAVGRTTTVPASPTELRIAAATCQHFETGFYVAHRDIAEWQPDLVTFLGDFIYEGNARPVGEGIVRSHEGLEPTDVTGYRARYATYLSDPDLQAARAACPWLVIWDDHEVENNYAATVPQDLADQATFAARRSAAYQAWWEHQPVRLAPPVAGEPFPVYRSVRWGGLAELIALDGRQYRSDQVCGSQGELSVEPPCPDALVAERTMLGSEQEAWLGETLSTSSATWPTLVQQTVMTDLRLGESILNYDQWDGYGPARDRLLAQATATDRLVVLTGDIHLAGVGVLPGVGVEFVTTSISSGGDIPPELQPILDTFPTVVASELVHRGYTRHTVTPETWSAEYRIVADVFDPASAVTTWQTFTVDAAVRDVVTAA